MMMLVSAGACAANELKTWSRKLRTLGKSQWIRTWLSLNTCRGTIKKLAVFARLHAFGDLDVFNIVVQTLEDGERPQFEVMAGIGCAVVDVVEVVDVVGGSGCSRGSG